MGFYPNIPLANPAFLFWCVTLNQKSKRWVYPVTFLYWKSHLLIITKQGVIIKGRSLCGIQTRSPTTLCSSRTTERVTKIYSNLIGWPKKDISYLQQRSIENQRIVGQFDTIQALLGKYGISLANSPAPNRSKEFLPSLRLTMDILGQKFNQSKIERTSITQLWARNKVSYYFPQSHGSTTLWSMSY